MSALEHARQKMIDDGAGHIAVKVFEEYFYQLEQGSTGLIPESTIEPLTSVDDLTAVDIDPQVAKKALGQTVFLKLNGGLGTSMGLAKAKSLLPVRDGMTFLDIIFAQIRDARRRSGKEVPLMLMNSFRTHSDTACLFPDDLKVEGIPVDFVQGREPKLLVDSLEPVTWPRDPELEWCPPGHGDIFTSLAQSDLLTTLLDQGLRYFTTSNADNLGAFPSAQLAGWFSESGASYTPELCTRTLADLKGGHLARRKSDGQIILRDTAQTPPEDMHFFTDQYRHPYFHTNNLWFNIEALRDLLRRTGGVVNLPLIRNKKHVDPTDKTSPEVYQIECASGAIVSSFSDSRPILVGRERFLPVKTTNDLFAIRSDSYDFGADARLRLNREQAPIARLDPQYFAMISDFELRTKNLPSTANLDSIEVTGDYFFDGTEKLAGDVHIHA
ncbi:UTP--glucose-1-phosphate uridylyltransferase [Arcanobacterium pluranimalium]|uniref:UTP--glucose-1-phosphate uridylyltransferase n=1 Tax=Arcanobacterium pluranimalium TaxID=108028 RepID=UPI00195B000C|nr:UTP--glucose-1-phosphate uridylyltransferase [Arcanobacterium pluranimalium]MBM7825273.1 UTP--glucose-1-phosphate uridylyltransferase [Arcanobacterium pluranimalium]